VGTLFINGKQVGTGRIDKTQANIFSADEGTDVGLDEGTAVSRSYEIPFRFTGKIQKVTMDLNVAAVAGSASKP
jgi:arylsulfatase